MRKRYRDKLKSCALCKPHKRGWALRWRPREFALMAVAERDAREAHDPLR